MTTPPPVLDVAARFADLVPLARTTVRLHPRRARRAVPVAASKLGGTFLWPRDEPWPALDEARVDRGVQDIPEVLRVAGRAPIPPGTSIPFAPVLQLRADDFPEIRFPPGADLFQLLWFPYPQEVPPGARLPDSWVEPRVVWRDSRRVDRPRRANPPMVKNFHGKFAHACQLHPERVVEYPTSQDLPPNLRRRIGRWRAPQELDAAEVDEFFSIANPQEIVREDSLDFHDSRCSAAPGVKVGGYVRWIQFRKTLNCTCGRPLDYLLTVADREWSWQNFQRWRPIPHRSPRTEPTESPSSIAGPGCESFHLFVCHHCPGFPTRGLSER